MNRFAFAIVAALAFGVPAHAVQMSPFDEEVHMLPGWDTLAECMTVKTNWLEECTEALNLDGKQETGKGNFDRAIKRFNEWLRLEQSVHAFNNRGVAYLKKGDLARAERDLHRALSLDRNYPQAWDALARVYLKKKRYILALEHINRAIKLNPNNAYLFEIRAEIYMGLKRFALSKDDVIRSARMHEEDAVSELAW